jgi:hypothetical protein
VDQRKEEQRLQFCKTNNSLEKKTNINLCISQIFIIRVLKLFSPYNELSLTSRKYKASKGNKLIARNLNMRKSPKVGKLKLERQ